MKKLILLCVFFVSVFACVKEDEKFLNPKEDEKVLTPHDSLIAQGTNMIVGIWFFEDSEFVFFPDGSGYESSDGVDLGFTWMYIPIGLDNSKSGQSIVLYYYSASGGKTSSPFDILVLKDNIMIWRDYYANSTSTMTFIRRE